MSAQHTPGPWKFERGGGHAYNRIIGSESVQTNGWPERINGVSNASYTDRVCENLGDPALPGPAANIALICAAPDLLAALKEIVAWMQKPGGVIMANAGLAAIAKAEGRAS